MKRILVTGGLGFIGSHTVVELQNEGFEVVIIDNLANTRAAVLDAITEITGIKPDYHNIDVRKKEDMKNFFDNNQVDGIIHFAAYKAVGESMEKPLEYYENNLSSLIYLLQEIRDRKLDNFIFSSSATVYGEAEKLPITENSPVQKAESVYGNTKKIGEEIIRDTSNAHGINTIALRYFNPIGAHESAKIGELPLGVPANLIPFVTQTAAGIREQLAVFGDDYPTEDGTAIRDYIHVVDLAKAHIAALKRLLNKENKNSFEYFNVGTGKGSSVLEVIKTFEKVNDLKLNYKIVDRRPGDVMASYADTTLANKELKWKTERGLDESLRSAWKWQEQQK